MVQDSDAAALRCGTGKEIFYQGLILALNGYPPKLYNDNDAVIYPGFGSEWKSS